MSDIQMLRSMIDKFLAEEEYEIVVKLSEAAEDVSRWQEQKDWEAKMIAEEGSDPMPQGL